MTITLTLGSNVLDLADDSYHVRSIDIGYPVVREVSSVRPDGFGADDTTEFFGARVVSLDVVCHGDRTALLDNLAQYLLPSARPVLTVDDRCIRLRPANRAVALTAPPHIAQVQAQFVAPDGVWEDVVESSILITPSFGGGVGRSYSGSRPRTYAASTIPSSEIVLNDGTAPAYPVVTLYGPINRPRILNVATGTEIKFNRAFAAGEFVEIDYRERTVRLNGDASLNVLNTLDVSASAWSPLTPGANRITLICDGYGDGANARVVFRSAYL